MSKILACCHFCHCGTLLRRVFSLLKPQDHNALTATTLFSLCWHFSNWPHTNLLTLSAPSAFSNSSSLLNISSPTFFSNLLRGPLTSPPIGLLQSPFSFTVCPQRTTGIYCCRAKLPLANQVIVDPNNKPAINIHHALNHLQTTSKPLDMIRDIQANLNSYTPTRRNWLAIKEARSRLYREVPYKVTRLGYVGYYINRDRLQNAHWSPATCGCFNCTWLREKKPWLHSDLLGVSR